MTKLISLILGGMWLGLFLGALSLTPAKADVYSPQYFVKNATSVYPLNPASTTLGTSTLNGAFNNLTINGVCSGAGCPGGGQGLSSSSAPTFAGATINGNVTSTSITVLNTSTASIIQNFDDILYVPSNYSTSSYNDLGIYGTNWYNQRATAGDHAVAIVLPPNGIASGTFATPFIASSTGTTLVVICPTPAMINWTGATSTMVLNPGTAANETFGSGYYGCLLNGNGRVGQTVVTFGGPNGSYKTTMQNDTFYNFAVGMVPGNNAPFIDLINNTWQYVTQPLPLNFNGLTNSGENTYIANNFFGGCEGSNVLGQGASSSIYIVNGAGVLGDGVSLDDCNDYVGGGTSETWISGWVENPGAPVTPYAGGPIFTIATSTTNSLTLIDPHFYNDVSSAVTSTVNGQPTIPPEYILDNGQLTIQGGWASALATASSVSQLVKTNATAFVTINGFLNASNGTTTGVTNIINTANGSITDVAGAGFFNCAQNNNGYAWCQLISGNTEEQIFGNGVYMRSDIPAGGNNTWINTHVDSSAPASSTWDIAGSFGCANAVISTSTTIPTDNGGNNYCSYLYNGAATSTLTFPPASATQNRWYTVTNIGNTLTLQATSTDVFSIANVTSTSPSLLQGQSLTFQNQNGSWVASANYNSLNGLNGAMTIAGTANQVIVATSTGTITLSTPQAIGTGSSVTFANVTSSVNGSVITASTTLKVPVAANPTVNASGSIAYDTNHNLLVAGDGNTTGTIGKTLFFSAPLAWTNGASNASDTITSGQASSTDYAHTTSYTIPANFLTLNKTLAISFSLQGISPGSLTNDTIKVSLRKAGVATTTLFISVPASECGGSQTCDLGALMYLTANSAVATNASLTLACASCSGGSAATIPLNRNTAAQPISVDTTAAEIIQISENFANNTNPTTSSLIMFKVDDVN